MNTAYQLKPKQVHAFKLEQRLTLADHVPAEPGEWLVVEENGQLRVMTDAEFTAVFEPAPGKPQLRTASQALEWNEPTATPARKRKPAKKKRAKSLKKKPAKKPKRNKPQHQKSKDGKPGNQQLFDWKKGKQLWIDGVRPIEIGKQLGCSDAAVYYRARHDKWPPRGKVEKNPAKRPKIPVQECPHCGAMTNVDPCERCHTHIRPRA